MARRKKRGLFKPAKHKYLAKIVSFKNPKSARKSAKKLISLFKRRKTKRGKLTILRATVYASNRAKASARRRNLSKKERKELLKVAEIYAKTAKTLSKLYNKTKK